MQNACQTTAQCPGGHYCDPGYSRCRPCSSICPEHVDCPVFCSSYASSRPSVFTSTSTKPPFQIAPESSLQTDVYFITVVSIISFVIITMIVLMICFVYVYRKNAQLRNVPYPTRTQSRSRSNFQALSTQSESQAFLGTAEIETPQNPYFKNSSKRNEKSKGIEMSDYPEGGALGTRPKDPHRHKETQLKGSSSESDAFGGVRPPRRHVSRTASRRSRPLKTVSQGTDPGFFPPSMVSQGTMTEIDPQITHSFSQQVSLSKSQPINVDIKTKPKKSPTTVGEKASMEEKSPLILKTENLPFQNSEQPGRIAEQSQHEQQSNGINNDNILTERLTGIPTTTKKKFLPPRLNRNEPRFDIDMYSMELEPADKDPLDRVHQRRLARQQQQRDKAKAEAVAEEARNSGEQERRDLDIATVLAPIKLRKSEEGSKKDESMTEIKETHPSLLLRETSDKHIEPASPSIQEDVPDLVNGSSRGQDQRSRSDAQGSRPSEDPVVKQDEAIRDQLRKMPYIKDHAYHGPQQAIDVFVDNNLDSYWVLSELVQITGEKPSRYHLKQAPDNAGS